MAMHRNVRCAWGRRGVAIILVVFIAFIMAVGLAFMISSGDSAAAQNKKALRQLQAYYLAQSAMQHTLMKLKLLPRESSIMLRDPGGQFATFNDIKSFNNVLLDVNPPAGGRDTFTLFTGNPNDPQDQISPYRGSFELIDVQHAGAHLGQKNSQDNFSISVLGRVQPYYPDPRHTTEEAASESIIISRFGVGDGSRP